MHLGTVCKQQDRKQLFQLAGFRTVMSTIFNQGPAAQTMKQFQLRPIVVPNPLSQIYWNPFTTRSVDVLKTLRATSLSPKTTNLRTTSHLLCPYSKNLDFQKLLSYCIQKYIAKNNLQNALRNFFKLNNIHKIITNVCYFKIMSNV